MAKFISNRRMIRRGTRTINSQSWGCQSLNCVHCDWAARSSAARSSTKHQPCSNEKSQTATGIAVTFLENNLPGPKARANLLSHLKSLRRNRVGYVFHDCVYFDVGEGPVKRLKYEMERIRNTFVFLELVEEIDVAQKPL